MTSQPIIPLSQSQAPYFAGVDIGGTSIKIGIVDDHGRTLGFEAIQTCEADGGPKAIQRCAETIKSIGSKIGVSLGDIARIGMGSPGTLCLKQGMLIDPPNLPHWHNFKIKSELENVSQRPVAFINDANAASFGEFWIGAGSQHDSLALLTLGTGVGGGIILDGNMINGNNSFGGECGHLVIDCSPNARLCVWGGGRGHLEAYASASAVAARAEEGLRAGSTSSLTSILLNGKTITAKRVYEAACAGDEFSLKIIDETGFYLGAGIASLVHAVDPGLVVLGGAMDFGGKNSPVGQRFLAKIRDEFRQRTFTHVFDGTTIDFATLGSDAGYIGAAGTARKEHYAQL